MIAHIRRWDPAPKHDRWHLRCDCGWEGHTAQHEYVGPEVRPRSAAEVQEALEALFLAHLGHDEQRTYVLVDHRRPVGFKTVADIFAQAVVDREVINEAEGLRRYDAQPQMVGTFVMPSGEPAQLLRWFEDAGLRRGTVELADGRKLTLPIGEVRTQDGKVFRLDE